MPTAVPSGDAELRSSNGRLSATLRIAPALVPFANGTRWALTVNGRTPGPTLRVRPGDRLILTLDNQMAHSTNLHTHGLRVSPSGNADNPFIEIPAGKQFLYEIDIPADHPGGTFWYHPHLHHHVAEQLFAGFFGAIVVEDAVDRLPELVAAYERFILLHDTRIGAAESDVMTINMMQQREGREGDVLVNGLQRPTFEAAAAKLERWRVLNASPSRFYRLKLDGHALHVMATDGGRLAAPRRVDELKLVPGERAELLVQPAAAGSYALRSLAVSRGSMMGGSNMLTNPEFELATFRVSGTASPAALPSVLAAYRPLAPVTPARTREVVFAMQGGPGGATFLIDGKAFEPGRVDVRVARDTVEDWVIRNTSPMDHPFHLHVWPFQVIEQSAGGAPEPGWKDTVNVPANSTMRLRIPFTGITGTTVFHCHILDHEDLGMMATIEVS